MMAGEDLGAVTLLSLHHVPSTKRLAYCLPTGEFLFAVAPDDAVRCFCVDAPTSSAAADARALYGRNLCQFLTPVDIERLEDLLHGHRSCRLFSPDNDNHPTVVVYIQGTNAAIAVQLETIPRTLRMARCIDAVQSVERPTHLFADASSFIVAEEDVAVVLATTSALNDHRSSNMGRCDNDSDDDDDSVGYSISPCSDVGLQLFDDETESSIDDELLVVGGGKTRCAGAKSLERNDGLASDYHGRLARRTSSAASTDIADEDDLFFNALNGSDDADTEPDSSLAELVFEADWAAEVVRASFRRSSADWSLRAAPVI